MISSNTTTTLGPPSLEKSAVSSIVRSIEKLKKLEESDDFKSMYKEFSNISDSYFNFKQVMPSILNELKKLKFVPLVSGYFTRFSKLGYFVNDDVWFATYYALNSLWNYTDACQDIANEVLLTSIPNILISNLLHKPFVENLSATNISFIITSSVSIIHNIVRYPGNNGAFKIEELKKFLVNLIRRCDTDVLGMISILTLSCLVDENELHLLEEGKSTIRCLIQHVNEACEGEDKRAQGFAIWELLNGLKSISANDNMKKSIVQENGIETFLRVLGSPSSENDVEKCLGILWNLCFDKEIKNKLVNDYKLRDVIKPFENHKSEEIKKCFSGISWLINETTEVKARINSARKTSSSSSKKEWKFDIFFSYAWSNKQIILQIRDGLLKSNLKVWIDLDQMKGSTLEAMADGIENSNVFVMAISDAYRTSPNCRTEAEYAYFLRKPIVPLIVELKYKPSSWLGIIMGSKTYYEFTERRQFSETLNNCVCNIKVIMNEDVESSNKMIEPLIEKDFVDSVKTENTVIDCSSEVYSWSKEDVRNWLNKYELGHLRDKFLDIDGKLLSSMVDIHSKSSDYLLETLRNEFNLKLVDVLKMNLAIKELHL